MEKRSDKYVEEKKVISRVNKNQTLYDEVNNKNGNFEIPIYETSNEINLSELDMSNLKREEFQKVKDYKELIDEDKKEDSEIKQKEIKKEKTYDINKILEEAKKNREKDELEGKRNLNDEANILNNLNKKYLYQKGFTEEDNEELKELIDTITSKTMIDDIKDEEEKELLSELLATTIDIKLEQELSETQIDDFVEEKANEKDIVDTNSFYSKSLELTAGDLLTEEEEKKEDDNIATNEEEIDENGGSAKIVFISLILLIIIAVVVYFVLKVLKVID